MSIFPAQKMKIINKVVEIDVKKISANPNQPRRYFNEDELFNLASSIKVDGIIQPITVRKIDERYEIISGERRFRAAKIVGMSAVPCIIVETTDKSSALLALVENIQRSDLSYFEEASAIAKLIEMHEVTQEETAIRLGMAQSTLANKLRLLKHSEQDKIKIIRGNLTERHARAFLKVLNKDMRTEIIDKVIKKKLNVEQTEMLIDRTLCEAVEYENFKKRAILFRDLRLFVNTINKAVETIKMAGLEANSTKTENDEFIEYHIKIARSKQNVNKL